MRPNTRVERIFGSFAIKSLDFDGGPAADIVTATHKHQISNGGYFTVVFTGRASFLAL